MTEPVDEGRLHTSLHWLGVHAGRTPGRIALIVGNVGAVDYGRFHADALRFRHALAELGVGAGTVVALCHSATYIHWLLIIACEALGAVAAMIAPDDTESPPVQESLRRTVDLILTERPLAVGIKQHLIDADWLRRTFCRHPEPVPAATEERTAAHLIWTSGTTEAPKGMRIGPAAHDWRIGHVTRVSGLTADSTFVVLYPLALNAVLTRAEACLRLGAKVAVPSENSGIWTLGGSHVWCLPLALEGLLRLAPPANKTPLRIITGGAPVSTELRRKARDILGAEILVGYGANEVGSALCLMDDDGVGTAAPGVELDIVTEDGRPVPAGDDGIIALRAAGMVDGYLDKAAASPAFCNGWFLTGDLGRRHADGRFVLHGRRGDMLNFGGIKISPAPVEDQIRRAVAGIADIAAVSLPTGGGGEELHLTLVPQPGADVATISKTLAEILPAWLRPYHLDLVAQLPRTASGKLRRGAVRALLRQ